MKLETFSEGSREDSREDESKVGGDNDDEDMMTAKVV